MRPTVYNQGIEPPKGLVIREYGAPRTASVRELTVAILESSGVIVEEALRARVEEVIALEPEAERTTAGGPLVVTSPIIAPNNVVGAEH